MLSIRLNMHFFLRSLSNELLLGRNILLFVIEVLRIWTLQWGDHGVHSNLDKVLLTLRWTSVNLILCWLRGVLWWWSNTVTQLNLRSWLSSSSWFGYIAYTASCSLSLSLNIKTLDSAMRLNLLLETSLSLMTSTNIACYTSILAHRNIDWPSLSLARLIRNIWYLVFCWIWDGSHS